MSDIQFNCPKCGHSLVVDAAGAGMAVPCPECNEPLIIPSPEEQAAAPVDNATAGVDAKSAVNTATSEPPLDKPMADGQTPMRSSVVRRVARVFWLVFKWLAMAACLIGWLINVAVRWIVVLPTLKARLARRYRKIGAQAYRNKIDEEKGSEIREQILAIDHDSQVSGAQPAEGHKSQSGMALFVARGMRRRRMKRLFAILGKDLTEDEAVSDSLSRNVRSATRTKQGIERIRSARPKIVAAGNFVLGMALVAVAVAAYYFRGDIPRLSIISTGGAGVTPRESGISIHASSEPISDVAPIVEVVPASIESSDADILSEQEREQLLKSIGRYCQFYVARRADVEKWPNWVYSGSGAIRENAWEIHNIVSFEPERWQAADPGILVTGPISFEREGQMQMWIREKRQMPFEDKNGFRRNLTVYELSPDADVQKYRRHMAAYQQKEQAIEAAKRNRELAEAAANKEKELALEKARRDEDARKALADAIEYAATVIPDAVRLPEVHLSKKIAERGFVAEIHTSHHSELFKSVRMKDWAEVVRIVSGKIETRKDVNDAVIRLTSYRDEFHYTPEWWNEGARQSGSTTIELSGESWEVAVEIISQDLVLDHRLIDMSGQIYLHLLKLPGDPKKLVYMKQDKINVDVPRYTLRSNDAGFYDGIWTCLAANNGFIYRVPLGGSKIFVFEDGVRSMAHEEFVESVWKAVKALNQQKTFGNNDTQELMDKGVQVASRYYQFVAGKLMTQF